MKSNVETPEGKFSLVSKQASVISVGQIEFDLRTVNPFIVCQLCAGYIVSATTIIECLHTCTYLCVRDSYLCVRAPTCARVTPTCEALLPARHA